MSKGNLFAFVVLFMWPIFSIWLYKTKTIQVATLWTIVGGFMVLPVSTFFDFPLIPPLGKHSMPVLAAIIGCWLVKGQRVRYFSNKGLLQVLVLFLFLGAFITAELNTDRVILAGHFLPGLTMHDAISAVIAIFLKVTPFFIGKQFFRSYQDQLLMFRFLAIAGIIYTLPMLYEIRMSPQLHIMFYGYFPHSFGQQLRGSGFRPVLFMGHGLWVAFFSFCALIAAVSLGQIKEKIYKYSFAALSYYLLVVLVLCKSKASLLYGLFAFIVIKKISWNKQIKIAFFLAMMAMLYPAMSIMKIFPHQQLAELAESYLGPERAESLVFRFNNEQVLLEHARKRLFFGWGGWGRNRVFDEETGKDMTVTDGRWIITFGVSGMVGFIAEFGLLAIGIYRAKSAAKWVKDKKELILLAAHALLMSIIMVDQLPNASLEPWLWLLAGILLGRSESIISENKLKLSVR